MIKIPAGVFKARCLSLMDEVQSRRETILITKRGKPVAELIPVTGGEDEIFGFCQGQGVIKGDIVSPSLGPEEWGELE